jgi:Ca2+-binding RTX toxin-like protein
MTPFAVWLATIAYSVATGADLLFGQDGDDLLMRADRVATRCMAASTTTTAGGHWKRFLVRRVGRRPAGWRQPTTIWPMAAARNNDFVVGGTGNESLFGDS